mgnify:FL=1
MKHNLLLLSIISLLFFACTNPCPVCDQDPCVCDTVVTVPDPEGTIYFTESDEIIANPERGFLIQTYYESGDLNRTLTPNVVQLNRNTAKISLYLQSLYVFPR